jgi:hypothetical protein
MFAEANTGAAAGAGAVVDASQLLLGARPISVETPAAQARCQIDKAPVTRSGPSSS